MTREEEASARKAIEDEKARVEAERLRKIEEEERVKREEEDRKRKIEVRLDILLDPIPPRNYAFSLPVPVSLLLLFFSLSSVCQFLCKVC